MVFLILIVSALAQGLAKGKSFWIGTLDGLFAIFHCSPQRDADAARISGDKDGSNVNLVDISAA